MRIAIIGGGPAGAALAWNLAARGVRAVVFDDAHPREKPCGGGVTERGWRALPLLATLAVPRLDVRSSTYRAPHLGDARVSGHDPIRVYARRDLDLAVLTAAADAGAEWRRERVRGFHREGELWRVGGEPFDLVVGADGAHGIARRTLGEPFATADRLVCVGWFLPGIFPPEIRVEFFPGFRGYAWFFPRRDHASVGIGAMAGEATKEELYARLGRFLARRYPGVDRSGATPYGGFAPCVKNDGFARYPLAGDGWAMVGDAAGLCDPVTGEGLYYAYASARLLAEALAGAPTAAQAIERYRASADAELMPELRKGSRIVFRFYRDGYLDAAMFLIGRSRSARRLAAEFIAGRQGFRTIRENVKAVAGDVFVDLIAARWR